MLIIHLLLCLSGIWVVVAKFDWPIIAKSTIHR